MCTGGGPHAQQFPGWQVLPAVRRKRAEFGTLGANGGGGGGGLMWHRQGATHVVCAIWRHVAITRLGNQCICKSGDKKTAGNQLELWNCVALTPK